MFGGLAIVLFFVTIVNSDVLLPLNKLWMQFGLALGLVVNPILMAIIFFVIFSPVGIFARLAGRDELRLRTKNLGSYWIWRDAEAQKTSFKNQF